MARAASATVWNIVGMIGAKAGLSVQIVATRGSLMVRHLDQRSADMLPTFPFLLSVSIHQLDKAVQRSSRMHTYTSLEV